MLKAQMQNELEVAKEELKKHDDREYKMREEISRVLGFVDYSEPAWKNYIRDTEKIIVLTWSQIFFELGKLKTEHKAFVQDHIYRTEQHNLWEMVERMNSDLNVLKDKDGGFKKDESTPFHPRPFLK